MCLNQAYEYRPQEAATTLFHKGASPARTKTDRYGQGSNRLTLTIMEEGTENVWINLSVGQIINLPHSIQWMNLAPA
jgi:hypothetical protein